MHKVLFQLCLSLGLIACTLSVDPTTVCYNQVFATRYYNIISEDHGRVVVDFNKQLYAEVSSVTGVRIVHDFADLKSFIITPIDDKNTSCKTIRLPQSHVMRRCLPPYAKQVSDASGYLGVDLNSKMLVQTWEVVTPYDTVYRVTLTNHKDKVPVVMKEFGYHGMNNAYLYFHPVKSISSADSKFLVIPEDCVKEPLIPSHIIV